MHEDGSNLPWTEEQWACLQGLVQESANRARVASSMLPVVGPLPPGQASVPILELDQHTAATAWYGPVDGAGNRLQRLDVDDSITRPLTTIACEVFVRSQQAADPELASVRQMLTRAAVIIGRLEDALAFEGQPGGSSPPTRKGSRLVEPKIYTVRGGDRFPGLRTATLDLTGADQTANQVLVAPGRGDQYGQNLIRGVRSAVDKLEKDGYYGPFACVLGHALYQAAHDATTYLVMPRDRFVPFLGGGPLLRSSTLPDDEGVIVATADAPVDLVIASDIHISYLQRTLEPRYVLRVSERLTLRIKQRRAIAHLVPPGGPVNRDARPGAGAAGDGGD
jgi:uncharacterized linocin/CFP29 family protein